MPTENSAMHPSTVKIDTRVAGRYEHCVSFYICDFSVVKVRQSFILAFLLSVFATERSVEFFLHISQFKHLFFVPVTCDSIT